MQPSNTALKIVHESSLGNQTTCTTVLSGGGHPSALGLKSNTGNGRN